MAICISTAGSKELITQLGNGLGSGLNCPSILTRILEPKEFALPLLPGGA